MKFKEKLAEFIHFQDLMDQLGSFSVRLVGALLVFWIGLRVVNLITRAVERALVRQSVDATLIPFLKSLINTVLKISLIISIASMLGLKTTSFITLLGAAGLAVGLALQGSLSNFAGGVLILFFRPFKVGDTIESSGYLGTVSEIQILNTVLLTPDNKTIFLPNGNLINNPVVNFSAQPSRRIDLIFGISYDSDIDKARYIIQSILKDDARFLDEPIPVVKVGALNAYSVDIFLRVWCKKEDFIELNFELHERVKKAFDKEGIKIPFPTTEMIGMSR